MTHPAHLPGAGALIFRFLIFSGWRCEWLRPKIAMASASPPVVKPTTSCTHRSHAASQAGWTPEPALPRMAGFRCLACHSSPFVCRGSGGPILSRDPRCPPPPPPARPVKLTFQMCVCRRLLLPLSQVDVPETTIGTSANRKPRIGRRGRYVHYNPLVDSMALVSPPKAPAEDLEDEDLDDPNVQAKLQQERQEQYYTLQHYIEGIEERAKPRGAQLPDVPLQGAAVAAKIAVAESPQGPIAKPKWNVDVDLDQVVLDVPPNDRMDEL